MSVCFSWGSPSSRLVLEGVLSILCEVGYDGLTVAEIKNRAGAAGRALGDLPDIDALVSAALQEVRLLQPAPATGSLRTDLVALVGAWRRPQSRDEMVIAAVLSAAKRHPLIRQAIMVALDRPIAQAVGTILHRAMPSDRVPAKTQTLSWVLRGLVLERLRSGPRAAVDLELLVDFLLAGLQGP